MLSLLQLTDSSFPTGGFSHSAGLESALQHKVIKSKTDLGKIIQTHLENTGSFSLPFVNEAFRKDVQNVKDLDEFFNASTSNHVANRASRKQGKSFSDTVTKVHLNEELLRLYQSLDHHHYPVVFGIIYSKLGIDLKTTQIAFLSSTLKSVISSAVRLDIIGAIEAQRLQLELQRSIPDIVKRNDSKMAVDAALRFPVIDVVQNCHDTLFSKLFYS
ncbi:hypothetical protein LOTGIDRAFT_118615 [Lottia gigantea]|uniref:Urease accessory protein UreF n=1 Tax=Lottia gigantea TaxID=225164 RepID=V4AKY4_LOTGI|nr:hypothetical protein LOTGIDRAFT_118615 [Lottia gigantea]ESO94256.1 hypothetical protein LOTGIDRAFT_118615 [Lottia gigantea]